MILFFFWRVRKVHIFLTTTSSPGATFSCWLHHHSSAASSPSPSPPPPSLLPVSISFVSLSLFKSSCCRTNAHCLSSSWLLASPPVRPHLGVGGELGAPCSWRSRWFSWWCSSMGRGSHGCSVLGSSLLLLFCLGSAAAQKASTWKTLSGNIHWSSLRFLVLCLVI